ncbi:hypothetical protein BHYA_0228g00090 [Botrytis hyacinthi]|uniref:Uncharacterized protein n=1 Tax=Botrytis hyacinthi TaxID=278943 RepID=A0A4Z1GEC1_9HELO|nr:hypothetical protein BHYA_0228g00090 [Botrytis hyacinthi]
MSQTRAAQSLVQNLPPLSPQYSPRTRKLSAREATRAFVSREVKHMVRVTRGDNTREMNKKLKSQRYQEDYEDAFKGE